MYLISVGKETGKAQSQKLCGVVLLEGGIFGFREGLGEFILGLFPWK